MQNFLAKPVMVTSAPAGDIRDAAEAALLAQQYRRTGERYIIANGYVSNRRLYGPAAAYCGDPPPISGTEWDAMDWYAQRENRMSAI